MTKGNIMKTNAALMILAVSVAFVGCESKAGTGALVGAGSGAIVGGVVGGPTGAVIGAGAGALGGAIIGAILDDQDKKNVENQSPQTMRKIDNGQQLNVTDVINLHKADVSDDKIIELIQKTDSRYRLSTYEIDKLRNAGVSNRVINYMNST